MVIKMIKFIVPVVASVLLFGCGNDKPNPYETRNVSTAGRRAYVTLITEIEDCKIYFVHLEESSNLYMARCGTENSLRWQSGKTSTNMITTEEKETLEKADRIKKRQAALSKLSAEDRELLNLPVEKKVEKQ